MDFFSGKNILITGHTGFKGTWLCEILKQAGANITGYSLGPKQNSLYNIVKSETNLCSYIADIRNYEKLREVFFETKPEIVIHLAAQPLVLDSYEQPLYTFEANIMGTVNLLDCIRQSDTVRSVVIITTDKVYHNIERSHGYKEADFLGGKDPYSASKACVELAVKSYKASFLEAKNIAISAARAGNVIGGGDISGNRIIPDCVRAATAKEKMCNLSVSLSNVAPIGRGPYIAAFRFTNSSPFT